MPLTRYDESSSGVHHTMRKDAALWEEIFEILSDTDSIEGVLPTILQRVLDLVGLELGAIFLLDPEARVLRLHAVQGVSGELSAAYSEIPLGEGIVGEVAEKGTREVVRDTDQEDRIWDERVRVEGIRAFMTVPIVSRGRVLGVLDVGTRRNTILQDEHLHLAGAIAGQLGVALDNAKLLIRSRRGERLYRHLVDHAPDLTFLCDADFGLVRMNERGHQFFGVERGNASAGSLEQLLGSEAFPSFQRARDHLVHGSRKGRTFEVTLHDREGLEQIFEFRSTLLREAGERFFLFFVGRNLTRRKQLESRLIDYTNRLAEMVERRTSELEKAKKQVADLFVVATQIHRLDSMDEKLRLTARSIAEARLFEKVWIRIDDSEGRPLHTAYEGFGADEAQKLTERAIDVEVLRSDRLSAQKIGGSFFLPVDGGESGSGHDWREGDLLVVPLIAGDLSVPIGCLVADEPGNRRRPDEETVRMIELFVGFAVHAIEEARREQKLAEADRVRSEYARQFEFPNLVGDTPAMRRVFDTVRRLAGVRTSVLVTGESGTGKEIVARAIHFNGVRRDGPFVKMNCAAIPESLIESELFGIERGVATDVAHRIGRFEQADGGTLFLDEVGDMSLATQAMVLRALQERAFERVGGKETIRVNVRIVAATNRNLEVEIERGMFRRDLFYRLHVVTIHLPPLRERREDIPLLTEHFIARCSRELNLPTKRLPPAILKHFVEGHWPGNVRQLQNCIERALVMGKDADWINWEDLPPVVRAWQGQKQDEPERPAASLEEALREREREMIEAALRRAGGVQKRAAEILGISERAMWYRVRKLGISIPSAEKN